MLSPRPLFWPCPPLPCSEPLSLPLPPLPLQYPAPPFPYSRCCFLFSPLRTYLLSFPLPCQLHSLFRPCLHYHATLRLFQGHPKTNPASIFRNRFHLLRRVVMTAGILGPCRADNHIAWLFYNSMDNTNTKHVNIPFYWAAGAFSQKEQDVQFSPHLSLCHHSVPRK